jgi:PAS domain S-box-containing protein
MSINNFHNFLSELKNLFFKHHQYSFIDENNYHIIDRLLAFAVIFGGISFLTSAYATLVDSDFLTFIFISLIYISIFIISATKYFNYTIKKFIINISIYTVGTILIFNIASFNASLGWLITAPLITLAFYNARKAFYGLIYIFSIFLVIAINIKYNFLYLELPFEFLELRNWLASIVGMLLISFFLLYLFTNILEALEIYIIKEKKLQKLYIDELEKTKILIKDLTNQINLREQVENELKIFNSRLQTAQKFGEIGIWEYDILNKNFWLSEKAFQILNIQQNGSNNISFDNLKSRLNKEAFLTLDKYLNNIDLLEKGIDIKFSSTNNNYKWIKFKGKKILNYEGKEIIIGSIIDITEDIKVIEKLKKSELWFESIFNNALDAILIIHNYKFIDCNSQSEKIFHLSKEEIINKYPFELSPEYQFDGKLSYEKAKFLIDSAKTQGHITFEWNHKDKFDNIFLVEVNLNHFIYDNEDYYVALLRDITEKKKYEQQIKELNISLEEMVSERTAKLNEALEEYKFENEERKRAQEELYKLQDELLYNLSKTEELSKLKSKFIELISHEYRTPLTALQNSTYIIEKYLENNEIDKIKHSLNIMKSSVNNMIILLEEVFETEKSHQLSTLNEKNVIEIVSYLKSIANEIVKGTNFKGKVKFFSSFNELVINSNNIAIRSIFSKILDNAIKFSNNNDVIIKLDISNDYLITEIIDEGIGIPSEDMDYIFEMFYKGTNSINYKGVGLGLTIARNYIKLLNGNIKVNSKLGKGTSVIVEIPCNF